MNLFTWILFVCGALLLSIAALKSTFKKEVPWEEIAYSALFFLTAIAVKVVFYMPPQ
jgi:hypothetical protein